MITPGSSAESTLSVVSTSPYSTLKPPSATCLFPVLLEDGKLHCLTPFNSDDLIIMTPPTTGSAMEIDFAHNGEKSNVLVWALAVALGTLIMIIIAVVFVIVLYNKGYVLYNFKQNSQARKKSLSLNDNSELYQMSGGSFLNGGEQFSMSMSPKKFAEELSSIMKNGRVDQGVSRKSRIENLISESLSAQERERLGAVRPDERAIWLRLQRRRLIRNENRMMVLQQNQNVTRRVSELKSIPNLDDDPQAHIWIPNIVREHLARQRSQAERLVQNLLLVNETSTSQAKLNIRRTNSRVHFSEGTAMELSRGNLESLASSNRPLESSADIAELAGDDEQIEGRISMSDQDMYKTPPNGPLTPNVSDDRHSGIGTRIPGNVHQDTTSLVCEVTFTNPFQGFVDASAQDENGLFSLSSTVRFDADLHSSMLD